MEAYLKTGQRPEAAGSEVESKGQTNQWSNPDEDNDKRQKFGTRFLTDPKNVFQHNAWCVALDL